MPAFHLTAFSRSALGKQNTARRHLHHVPAVLYGHGIKNQNLEVDERELTKIYRQAGASSLVDLKIDTAAPIKVLIHQLQRHPVTPRILHVDFYQVKMSEKLQTDIELNFVGESPAVKEQGGILVRALDKVKVESLPGDLVPTIEVDISSLKTFDDRIRVADIKPPAGLIILDNSEEIVATVTPPRSEAELEALSGKVEEDVAQVGVVEKPAKEEEVEAEATATPTPPTKEQS